MDCLLVLFTTTPPPSSLQVAEREARGLPVISVQLLFHSKEKSKECGQGNVNIFRRGNELALAKEIKCRVWFCLASWGWGNGWESEALSFPTSIYWVLTLGLIQQCLTFTVSLFWLRQHCEVVQTPLYIMFVYYGRFSLFLSLAHVFQGSRWLGEVCYRTFVQCARADVHLGSFNPVS